MLVRIANREDADQTASSGSSLFAVQIVLHCFSKLHDLVDLNSDARVALFLKIANFGSFYFMKKMLAFSKLASGKSYPFPCSA